MIKVTADAASGVLIIEAHGLITEADIDAWIEALQAHHPGVGVRLAGDAAGRGGLRVLFDWEHLDGWEQGAKTLGTVTGMALRDVVHKAAIVADEKWHGERERIQDAIAQAEVRWYAIRDRAAAWTWLKA